MMSGVVWLRRTTPDTQTIYCIGVNIGHSHAVLLRVLHISSRLKVILRVMGRVQKKPRRVYHLYEYI